MAENPSLPGKYKYFTVGAIGTFMATLDGSILNVALPTISRDLNAPIDLVAWVVLSYSLTLISLMLIFGAWVDRRGYFFGYQFGYIFFILGSILCSLATNIEMLLFGRVVQAVGTAMFAAIGPGLVTTVFPKEERGKGIGLMIMMVSAGFMIGFPLGGVMLGIWTWHSLFIVNLPIGAVGLWFVYAYFGRLPKPEKKGPFPLRGGIAVSLTLVTFTYALSLLDNRAVSDPLVLGLVALSVMSFVIFIFNESKAETALIGLGIFKNRLFTLSISAQTMQFLATSGAIVLLPFYFEEVLEYAPKDVGLRLFILPIMMFVFAPLSGRLSDKIGFRLLTTFGLVVIGLGLLMISNFTLTTTDPFIFTSLALLGAGVGIFSTPNSSALMGSVTEKERAITSGILATNRNIGMAVGVALATSLFSHFQKVQGAIVDKKLLFAAAYQPVLYSSMIFVGIGIIFCILRSSPLREQKH
ncbi:MAG: MFS transporter [candidate division Zixibacteria bacterium]|nr:MFS transporter [candidate division Zixibacteria bacterium]